MRQKETEMMQTLIIVLIVLLIAFNAVMIAICRIEAQEDERMMRADEEWDEEMGEDPSGGTGLDFRFEKRIS